MTSSKSLGNRSHHTLPLEEQPLALRQLRHLPPKSRPPPQPLMPLFPSAPAADRKGLTSVIVGAPLGSLGLGMAALLFYCWLKRKVGWYL